jgi:hypothetical protein
MRIVNLAVLSLLTIAACEARPGADETGRADTGMAADTVITSERTQDTAIVTQDTAVDVDTAKREGDTTRRDTLQK